MRTASQVQIRERGQTREAIMSAASRLMHLKGYKATSVDDVLRESGVGKGNFYHYFRSKEDLGYAILDQVITSFVRDTLEPCFSDPAGQPLVQMRCFLDHLLQAQRVRNCVGGCPMGNLASELSDVHEGFRARLAQVFSAWQERFTQALHEARRQGEVGEDCRPEAVAHFLVASLEGSILMAKVTKDITVMEQCVEEMKRHLALYERRRP